MRIFFATTAITCSVLFCCAYAEQPSEFELPSLPTTNINKVENELDDQSLSPRAPSSNDENEDEYLESEQEVKSWDYQNVIDSHDRHDKH